MTGTVLRDKLPKIILSALLAMVISTLGWSYAGREQAVPDAITKSAKMHCASYAPFRGLEHPGDPQFRAPPERIDSDLALLAKSFECVRTYTTDQGIDQVLPMARKHGLKVFVGAWIGRDPEGNAKEIARTIAAVLENPDVVRGVIVGNEVLLRGELLPAKLKALITQVKEAVGAIPVTYADVWEFWLENRGLADAVDFVTVHILPYWENQPTPVNDAIDHVQQVLGKVTQSFPAKHILIGETGWPSKGRMREGAEPSLVAQATYNRAIITYTEAHGIETNLVEAFDQPWKRKDEGTVGGNWGIYDSHQQLKQTLTGPVSNYPLWRLYAAISGVLASGLLALCIARAVKAPWLLAIALAPCAALAGSMLTLCGADLINVRLTIPDLGGGLLGMVLICATAICFGLHWFDQSAARGPTMPDHVLDRQVSAGIFDLTDLLGLLRMASLIGVLSIAVSQIFDPRYRDFPIATYILPATAFTIEGLRRQRWARIAAGPVEQFLCWALVIAAAAILLREGIENIQAIGFVIIMILLSLRIATAGKPVPVF